MWRMAGQDGSGASGEWGRARASMFWEPRLVLISPQARTSLRCVWECVRVCVWERERACVCMCLWGAGDGQLHVPLRLHSHLYMFKPCVWSFLCFFFLNEQIVEGAMCMLCVIPESKWARTSWRCAKRVNTLTWRWQSVREVEGLCSCCLQVRLLLRTQAH